MCLAPASAPQSRLRTLEEQSKEQPEELKVTLKHSGLRKTAEILGCDSPLDVFLAMPDANRRQRMIHTFGLAASGCFLKQTWVITLPRST